MAAQTGDTSRAAAFLSTHPAPSQRIENIQMYLPEAMAVRSGTAAPGPPAPGQNEGFTIRSNVQRKE
jgi:hypothetical protein